MKLGRALLISGTVPQLFFHTFDNFTRLISAYRNQNKASTVTKIDTYSEILWTNWEG